MKYFILLGLIVPSFHSMAEEPLPPAQKENMDCIVKSMIQVESSFNNFAVSNKGALGLMQIMYSTAQDMGFKGLPAELFNPHINRLYGVRYVKFLLRRYHNHLFLALDAYNRGMKMVDDYPYEGDWNEHPYVGPILKAMQKFCNQPPAPVLATASI